MCWYFSSRFSPILKLIVSQLLKSSWRLAAVFQRVGWNHHLSADKANTPRLDLGDEADTQGYKPLRRHIRNQETAMEYSHRYQACPTQEIAERLEHHLNVHRQLYNHVRWDYEQAPEDDKPSEYDQNNKLPEWKRKWPLFSEITGYQYPWWVHSHSPSVIYRLRYPDGARSSQFHRSTSRASHQQSAP